MDKSNETVEQITKSKKSMLVFAEQMWKSVSKNTTKLSEVLSDEANKRNHAALTSSGFDEEAADWIVNRIRPQVSVTFDFIENDKQAAMKEGRQDDDDRGNRQDSDRDEGEERQQDEGEEQGTRRGRQRDDDRQEDEQDWRSEGRRSGRRERSDRDDREISGKEIAEKIEREPVRQGVKKPETEEQWRSREEGQRRERGTENDEAEHVHVKHHGGSTQGQPQE